MHDPELPPPSSISGRFQALLRQGFQRLAALWATPGVGRSAVCSPIVGFIAGLGAVAFLLCLQAMYRYVLGGLLHFHMPPTLEGEPHAVTYPWPWWLVLLVPTVGGLISGILVFTWAPEAEGHGTDAMVRAFHLGGGYDPGAGPADQVGRLDRYHRHRRIRRAGGTDRPDRLGFGSYLARVLELPPSERRILMLAGAAAGIGAIFRAPLGGAFLPAKFFIPPRPSNGGPAALPGQLDRGLFDVCSVHHAQADLQLARALLSGIAGSAALRGPDSALRGFRLALCSRLLRFAGQALQAHAHPEAPQAGRGRVFAWPAGPGLPEVMTGGYGWVQWGAIGMPPELTLAGESSFVPHMGMGLLLPGVLKIVATGFTISSGGSGGVFGPVDADRRHDRRGPVSS